MINPSLLNSHFLGVKVRGFGLQLFNFFFKKKNSLKSPQTPKCLGLTPSLRASNK
jgi:hypothetical protein